MSGAAEKFCIEQGSTPQPAAAEAHNQNARLENRIGFFKALFTRVSKEVQLTEKDDAWSWSGRIAAATNKHLRYGGFNPNQCVFGRDPRVAQSLLTGEGRRQAQVAANTRYVSQTSRGADPAHCGC